jgi:hypothetical protein
MIDKPSGIKVARFGLDFILQRVCFTADYAGKQFPVRILQYDFFSGEFRIMQNVTGKRGSAGGT